MIIPGFIEDGKSGLKGLNFERSALRFEERVRVVVVREGWRINFSFGDFISKGDLKS